MKAESKKSAELKQKLLKWTFGEFREAWEGQHQDDRSLMMGCYDQLMEATEAMKKMDNNFVWCAFNHRFNERWNMMAEIVERFTGKHIDRHEVF